MNFVTLGTPSYYSVQKKKSLTTEAIVQLLLFLKHKHIKFL